ncbi:MAG: hypothetical protein HYZ48_03215, partial [Chlamydiales bacterium]|nr:hypothetical protein [Chlamydiales bacterium]
MKRKNNKPKPKSSRPPAKKGAKKKPLPQTPIQPPTYEEVITGILRMHPKGFGFVIPDYPNQCPEDVFIPKHLTDHAVDADHVEVLINPHSNWEKGPEGKIINILKRARKHLAGIIRQLHSDQSAIAYAPILGTSKPVLVKTTPDIHLKIGDRIIMTVAEWGS